MTRSFVSVDWSEYAQCYDALNTLIPYTQMLDSVERAIGNRYESILEAGCGTGNLTVRLLGRSASCTQRVWALDYSPDMLSRAKQKCEGMNGHFLQADLNDELPFDDGMFDCVVCVNALYALREPLRTLVCFERVLRPGGTLIVVTPRKGYQNGLILKEHCGSMKPDDYWLNIHASPAHEETLLREAIPDTEVADQFLRVGNYNRRIAIEQSFHFFTERELRGTMELAGFHVVEEKSVYANQNIMIEATRTM